MVLLKRKNKQTNKQKTRLQVESVRALSRYFGMEFLWLEIRKKKWTMVMFGRYLITLIFFTFSISRGIEIDKELARFSINTFNDL